MTMPERMIGTVAGVYLDGGFFFICGSDNRDYYAKSRDLPDYRSLMSLVPRQTRIEFTPEIRDKGPAASNLVILADEEPRMKPTPPPPPIVDPDAQPSEDPTVQRLGIFRKERKK